MNTLRRAELELYRVPTPAGYKRRNGLMATAAPPLLPQKAWFKEPERDEPVGLTVTNEGQVFGRSACEAPRGSWGLKRTSSDVY